MPERAQMLVPAVIAIQALMVSLPGTAERPPAVPDLPRFPSQFAQWNKVIEEKIDPEVERTLGADQLLSWTYENTHDHAVANLFVAWYQSLRGGKTQPHSPQVCLPGAGWIPEQSGEIQIATPAGTIPANRYVVSHGEQHAVVLYWYQTPRRVLAGEWESIFWRIPDAIRDQRTDTSLVRIVVWTAKRNENAATLTASDFARSLYPILRSSLPR